MPPFRSAGPGTLGKGAGALLHRPLARAGRGLPRGERGREAGDPGGQLHRVAGLAGRRRQTTELVKGLILNNCAGGMNSKFAVTDPAVSEPSRAVGAVFFAVLDFLLGIKPLARSLFDSVRARERRSGPQAGLHEQRARRQC